MDNPNIAFKRMKDKKRGRPTSEKLRNSTRTVGKIKRSVSKVKVDAVRQKTGAGMSECITALRRKGGSVRGAISYIRYSR